MSSSSALGGAHYFEDGNVQLDAKHECKDSIVFYVITYLHVYQHLLYHYLLLLLLLLLLLFSYFA